MFKILSLLAALIALGLAAEPTPGDVGMIQHCVPGDDNEDCKSCFEEREEEEEEEGEEQQPQDEAYLQKCIDTCSESYRITQLDEAKLLDRECEMNGGEDCEEKEYLRLDLTPGTHCINGCSCPNATGYYEKPEENDENKEEDQRYDLVFYDNTGEIDRAFTGGSVEIKAPQEDGAEAEVILEIEYTVIERKDDDQAEDEQRVMDCKVPYTISAGKVGGIEASTGGEVPPIPQIPQIVQQGNLAHASVYPEECATQAEGSADHCFYMCSLAYQVHTENNSFTMVPDDGFMNDGCECTFGKGFQVGAGLEYSTAQVTFGEDYADMCTSSFKSTVFDITVSDPDYHNKFTLQYPIADGSKCTIVYNVAKGQVLGKSAPKSKPSSSAAQGGAVAGIIIGVIAIVAVIVIVVKKKGLGKRSYQGIP